MIVEWYSETNGGAEMTAPIDKMMDKIQWEVLKEVEEEPIPEDMPYATHRGILKIGDCELEVFQLSNGQRVISEESLIKFFT